MIEDFRDLGEEREIQADLCIVGGGAAGIALAREFAGSRHRVCLLESGGFDLEAETQHLYHGDNLAFPSDSLDAGRLRYFGGTTNHWGHKTRPLDDVDFAVRPWVPHSGWPFGRDELVPFYRRAQEICGMGPFAYDGEVWDFLGIAPPALDPSRLHQPFWQVREPFSFGEVYRDELRAADNIRVLLHANVTEIRTSDDGNRVDHLAVRSLAGHAARVRARHTVLACGGIESARLLLLSDGVEPAGLGNRHDLVGRFYMEHLWAPWCAMIVATDSEPFAGIWGQHVRDGIRYLPILVPSPEFMEREEILHVANRILADTDPDSGVESAREIWNDMGEGEAPDRFWERLGNVFADIDEVAVGVWRRIFEGRVPYGEPRRIYLDTWAEQAPNPDSRVLLSGDRDALGQRRTRLDWRLTDLDWRTIGVAATAIGQEIGRLGLGRLRLQGCAVPDAGRTPSENFQPSWHNMGTTRMSDDPRRGVVDRHCAVHGVAGLHIASASVFPTAGHAKPTLTVLALALRLADRLRADLEN